MAKTDYTVIILSIVVLLTVTMTDVIDWYKGEWNNMIEELTE